MQQINTDEVILGITMAMYKFLNQEQLQELKTVLIMHLSKYTLSQEETAVSTVIDDTTEKINLFAANLKIEGRTDKTIKAYLLEYRTFFQQVNKNYKDITTNDIRMYLAYCKTSRKNNDTTINNKIHYLSSLFNWLTAEEYRDKNPMLKIHIAKTEKKVKEVLSDEQVEITRCSCEAERDLAVFEMLMSTGVRVGELVKLNREDIDFINGQCIVYGKGRKERFVYLNAKAKIHLMWYLESRTDDNPALFVSLKEPHERLTEAGVRAILNRIAGKGKIKNLHLHPHKVRRTMATNMIDNGAPVEAVQQLLGHTSVQTTLMYYYSINNLRAKEAHRKYG